MKIRVYLVLPSADIYSSPISKDTYNNKKINTLLLPMEVKDFLTDIQLELQY